MVHHLRRHDVFSLRARKPTPKREWRLQRTKKATLLGCPGIRLWRRFARPAPAKRACRASGGECGPVFLRFARENPLQSEGDASNEQKKQPCWVASFVGGATRIRTGGRGVADLCLTAWLWRRIYLCYNIISKFRRFVKPFSDFCVKNFEARSSHDYFMQKTAKSCRFYCFCRSGVVK